MRFPDGTLQLLQKEISRLRSGALLAESHIEVFVVRVPPFEEEPRDALLDSWELVSLYEYGMELKLNFTAPLQVSSGSKPDLLLV